MLCIGAHGPEEAWAGAAQCRRGKGGGVCVEIVTFLVKVGWPPHSLIAQATSTAEWTRRAEWNWLLAHSLACSVLPHPPRVKKGWGGLDWNPHLPFMPLRLCLPTGRRSHGGGSGGRTFFPWAHPGSWHPCLGKQFPNRNLAHFAAD